MRQSDTKTWGKGFSTVEDLQGCNYGGGDDYDRFHAAFPRQPIFGSETASTLTTRGEYADDRRRTFVSSYNMTDGAWKPVADRTWMCGAFPWTGFDYKGEPTPYQWPCINSHFGIVDMCGFPKDNYYYYQAWWKLQPVVHLMPHWNWSGKEGQDIRVIAFSNCARVELWLNGQSLGAKAMPRYEHLEWRVKYAPGTLMAKGFDAAGRATASDSVQTTGAARGRSLEHRARRAQGGRRGPVSREGGSPRRRGADRPHRRQPREVPSRGPRQRGGRGKRESQRPRSRPGQPTACLQRPLHGRSAGRRDRRSDRLDRHGAWTEAGEPAVAGEVGRKGGLGVRK